MLAIWIVLSIPMSILLGSTLRTETPAELVGMDGDNAVYRRADGALERVALIDRTAA
jgi:hypothetical protein